MSSGPGDTRRPSQSAWTGVAGAAWRSSNTSPVGDQFRDQVSKVIPAGAQSGSVIITNWHCLARARWARKNASRETQLRREDLRCFRGPPLRLHVLPLVQRRGLQHLQPAPSFPANAAVATLGLVSTLLILFRIVDPPVFSVEPTVTFEGAVQWPIFLALAAAAGIACGGCLALQTERTGRILGSLPTPERPRPNTMRTQSPGSNLHGFHSTRATGRENQFPQASLSSES